jgi:hypothetical protein
MRTRSKFPFIFRGVLMGILFVTAVGFAVTFLWNWLIPELFHGPVINFWQALGLCLLGKILFGWHGGGHHGAPWGHKRDWRRRMQEKMAHMTPEQREMMRERLRQCAPFGRRWGGPDGPWGEQEKETPSSETNNQL